MKNLQNYRQFKKILENDNLAKSLSSMDKFGMKDDELPKELIDLLLAENWTLYEEECIFEEIADKHYSANLEYNTCIGKLKEGNFPKQIKLIIELTYVIEMVREIGDLSDLKIMVKNIVAINDFLLGVEKKKYGSNEDFEIIDNYIKELGITGKYDLKIF